MLEMGRFCTHPDFSDPDIVRVAWAALTGFVDQQGVKILFGCTSFNGIDPDQHVDAFALLNHQFLAPLDWRPEVKSREYQAFEGLSGCGQLDFRRSMRGIPPLLRAYFSMGGRVSDHAVIDRDLNTMHVFTGLEVKNIPPARVRQLKRDSR